MTVMHPRRRSDDGEPLDPSVRSRMERYYGRPFDDVEVRTEATDAAAMGAKAYTVGTTVSFAPGQYQPDNLAGQAVIAHELAHVIQQSNATPGAGTDAGRALGGEIGAGTASDERAANQALMTGRTAGLVGGGLRLSRCNGKSGSSGKTKAPAAGVSTKPPVKTVFEQPGATDAGTVAATFGSYQALSDPEKTKAFDEGYASGNVKRALRNLGAKKASDTFPLVTKDLLARITEKEGSAPFVSGFLGTVEQEEAVASSGKSLDDMAAVQAKKEKSRAKPAAGWGGSAPGKTRWEGLSTTEQDAWTKRAGAAIPKMVAHVNKNHPEFKATNATFEWKPKEVDETSEGALATVGSIPGKNLQIGFEFVVLVEVDPAYAMSTIAHELLGHAAYDETGSNFQAALYAKARTKEAGLPSGTETYDYWPSEIYSLLREAQYYTGVSATDDKKTLSLPGGTQKPSDLNYAPDIGIGWHLDSMKDRWHPDLLIPILQGFNKRIRVDPVIKPAGIAAFETAVRRKFKKTDADKILK